MTVLEASKAVLKKSGRPMSGREIFEAIRAEGLWQPSGKTPVATIGARIYVDMRKPRSCFVKVAKGVFGLKAWGAPGVRIEASESGTGPASPPREVKQVARGA